MRNIQADRFRRPSSIVSICAAIILVTAFFVYFRFALKRYVASCQPIVKAEEQVLTDISSNAGNQTIEKDFAVLSTQVHQWKPDLRFMLGKGRPPSFDELTRSLSDLDSCLQSVALFKMKQRALGDLAKDQLADERTHMKVYAASARDHLNQARELLSDGR